MLKNSFYSFVDKFEKLNVDKVLFLWNYQTGKLSGNNEFNLLWGERNIILSKEELYVLIEKYATLFDPGFHNNLHCLISGKKNSVKEHIPLSQNEKHYTFLNCSLYRADESIIHGYIEIKYTSIKKEKEVEYYKIKTELWKTKKHFLSLTKALPGQMFRFSNKGILLDFSIKEKGIFSVGATQFIGSSLIDIFSDEIAHQIQSKIEEVSSTNDVTTFECVIPFNNSENFYEVHMAPNNNEDVVCIFNDITPRKSFQQSLHIRDQILSILAIFSNKDINERKFLTALQESFQKIGETLDLCSIFMIQHHENNNTYQQIMNWNHGDCELHNYIDEFSNLLPISEMHERHLQGRVWIAREDTAPNYKIESFLKSSEICSIVTVPIFKLGKYSGILGLIKKAPDHYWAKAELDAFKLFTNAIGTSISRNQYISELIYAREKAEENEKMKSSFLANMSHEIRTPLNSIMGFSEIIGMKDISGGERKLFSSLVQKNSQHLLYLINDILDLAKIESGKSTISKSVVHVNHLIEEIYMNFRSQDLQVDLIKECGLTDNQALLHTDIDRLTQVINNLLNNAIKFTEKGHIKFGYYLEKGMLKFFVSDTGIGICPQMHKAIFNQFQQADKETSCLYGGTGLGLSICKKLINLLGGNIWVESSINTGSTFYFTLPYEPQLTEEYNSNSY